MNYFNELKNSGSKVAVLSFASTEWKNNHTNRLKPAEDHKLAPVDNP
jgi:hypothetical protein